MRRGMTGIAPWVIALVTGWIILAAPATKVRAAPHTIKIATVLPQGGPWSAAMARFAADVKQKTRGNVIFKLYFGAVAGTDERAIARMRSNQIQGLAGATAGLSTIDSSIRVLELPMLFDTYKEFWFVLRSMQPEFVKRYDSHGYRLLGLAGIGWVHIYSKYPINNLADFRNRKIWRWKGDPMAAALFQLVGVRGQTLPLSDVLPSLQAGNMDTCYGMPHTTQALQWHTALSYMLDLRVTMAMASIVIRKDAFSKLSPEQQKIVLECAKRMVRELNTSSSLVNLKAKRAMISGGMKLLKPSPSFIKELDQVRKRLWIKLRGTLYQPRDLKKVKALLTLCRNTSCRS